MANKLEDQMLDDAAVAEGLKKLEGWQREGDKIGKTFQADSFLEAIAFVNRVAVVAEGLNHHPDFEIHYKKVKLLCWTHKHNGLSQADLELATGIEKMA